MSAISSSAKEPRARAWILYAQFDVALHPGFKLANPDTDQIFPEYLREFFNTRASYLNTRLKSVQLISVSMQTALSSQANGYRDVVHVNGIFHGSHLVSERALQGIFDSSSGVSAAWDALYCGHAEVCPSLDDHAVFKTFLRENSLGGKELSLLYRVDHRGVRLCQRG